MAGPLPLAGLGQQASHGLGKDIGIDKEHISHDVILSPHIWEKWSGESPSCTVCWFSGQSSA